VSKTHRSTESYIVFKVGDKVIIIELDNPRFGEIRTITSIKNFSGAIIYYIDDLDPFGLVFLGFEIHEKIVADTPLNRELYRV
jgi:hypothetical protein